MHLKNKTRQWITTETLLSIDNFKESDLQLFSLEGKAELKVNRGALRMTSQASADPNEQLNTVLWCKEKFPDNIAISWDFKAISEPGLAIIFFAALGQNGQSIFNNDLIKRTGIYKEYHHGDINAYHISYFRRRYPDEKAFHTCNLRKSYGFHLVAQGADPLPSSQLQEKFYRIKVIKYGDLIQFYIENLLLFEWHDDEEFGSFLQEGYIGFRQMSPLCAEYKNLKVEKLILDEK